MTPASHKVSVWMLALALSGLVLVQGAADVKSANESSDKAGGAVVKASDKVGGGTPDMGTYSYSCEKGMTLACTASAAPAMPAGGRRLASHGATTAKPPAGTAKPAGDAGGKGAGTAGTKDPAGTPPPGAPKGTAAPGASADLKAFAATIEKACTDKGVPQCCANAAGGGSCKDAAKKAKLGARTEWVPVKAEGNPVKGCGDKAGLETAFKTCVEANRTKAHATTCKDTLTAQMQSLCGTVVDKVATAKLEGAAARDTLAACKMAKKANSTCDADYRTMIGAEAPTDAKKGALMATFEAADGAKDAMATEMRKCMNNSKDAAVKAGCMTDMQTKLGNLMGKNFTKAELAGTMRTAGMSAAGSNIKDCLASAANVSTKDNCMNSDHAKKAFAEASGRNQADIKDVDLKGAAVASAMKDVKETVNACVKEAGNSTNDKKACFKRPGLKQSIADSQNLDPSKIKDSKVRAYAEKSAQADVLTVMQNCDKKADLAKCQELMKEMYSQGTGRAAKDITNDDLKKDASTALKSELAEKMTACMEEAAGVNSKQADCKNSLAKAAIMAADFSGKEPSKAKIAGVLKAAAQSKAKDVMRDCDGNRTECMALTKDRIAKSMGKGTGTVSTKDAEMFNKAGAIDAMKDSAKACTEAMKDNASATCDDLYDQYMATRKKAKPTSVVAQKTEKARLMVKAAGAQVKENLAICYDYDNKSQVDECMKGFKTKSDEITDQLLGGNATSKAARKKLGDAQAKTAYLGERLQSCMDEANDTATKKACQDDLKSKMVLAGVKTSPAAVMKAFQAKEISEAATACSDADRAACLASAKKSFTDSGMKEREYKNVKKLGEVMAAAEVFAACQQGDTGATADDCENLAKEEFASVSGAADADKAWTNVKAAATKLSTGIINGADIVVKLKQQLAVSAETASTSCDDTTDTALAQKIKAIAATDACTGICKDIFGSKAAGCMLVDGKAEYFAKVGTKGFTENQTDAAADLFSAALKGADLVANSTGGRRLLAGRRLVAVTASYAAQESEFCASDDSSCGQTDDFSASSGTTQKPSGSGTTTKTPGEGVGRVAASHAAPQQQILGTAVTTMLLSLAVMQW